MTKPKYLLSGHLKKNLQNSNLGLYLTTCTKINSKWIIDLHLKAKTIKLLDKNKGESFHNFKLGKDLQDIPKAQSIKKTS